jgi:hypothetical protein
MKYAVEMGSGVMMYILSSGSGIRKLIRGATQTNRYIETQTRRQHGDSISLLSK